MARIAEFTCLTCGKHETSAVGAGSATPTVCTKCRKIEDDIKRREHFAGLDGLTVEERLRRVEIWIYDYRTPININDVRF